MRYRFMNNGRTTRVLRDADNRTHVIAPGQYVDIDVTGKEAARIKKMGGVEASALDKVKDQARARVLLDQADEIDFSEFRNEAREILGDDYPSGSPKKTDLVELLQKALE